jgi:DUF4097 and DUF4098 domain-containing protein YvlB
MASPVVVPPAYKRRRSLAGPLVLIIIGVFFLLVTSNLVTWPMFGHYFARLWPLLLILWGVVRLTEYYNDRQRGYATRGVGAGGVLLIVFLVILGLVANSAERMNWNGIRGEVGMDDQDFWGMFGQTYTFNASQQQDLSPDVVKTGTLRVISDHGDVTVNAWDDAKVKVDVTKKVRANDQNEASKVDTQTQPTISIDGNVITVNANTAASGKTSVESDLEIWVPKTVMADVATRRGDIAVSGRGASVKTSTSRGDVSVSDITGNVDIEQRKGDIAVSKISGDVNVNGQISDSNISEVQGALKLNGDYFGDMTLSKIAKGVTFHSSRTDMELARLDGDLNMQSGDLRANNLAGPMRVLTKSKDIHLDDLSGDLRVENSNGSVEVHSNKLGTIEIQNRTGDVQVIVPEKSNFQIEASTRNGEFQTDFSGLKISTQNDNASASGSVGNGGPKLTINNEHGNIEVRKAGAANSSAGQDD